MSLRLFQSKQLFFSLEFLFLIGNIFLLADVVVDIQIIVKHRLEIAIAEVLFARLTIGCVSFPSRVFREDTFFAALRLGLIWSCFPKKLASFCTIPVFQTGSYLKYEKLVHTLEIDDKLISIKTAEQLVIGAIPSTILISKTGTRVFMDTLSTLQKVAKNI